MWLRDWPFPKHTRRTLGRGPNESGGNEGRLTLFGVHDSVANAEGNKRIPEGDTTAQCNRSAQSSIRYSPRKSHMICLRAVSFAS
jgi:hypothetical protein